MRPLPCVPVRVLGGSLPVVVMGGAAALGALTYLFTSQPRPARFFDTLDLLFLVYLGLSAVGTLWSPSPFAPLAFIKSAAYFAAYLGIKCLLAQFQPSELLRLVRLGAFAGVATLAVGAAIGASRVGVANLLANPFGYWTFTFVLFREVLAGGVATGFTGANVMINAVGEGVAVFAMLFISGTGWGWPGRRRGAAFILASTLALLTFSRRATLALLVGLAARVIGARTAPSVRMIRLSGLAIAGVLVVAFAEATGDFFYDPARVDQIGEVYRAVAATPITGVGYASRVSGDRYVHNFLIGSLYAMGIPGLLAALAIFGLLVRRLIEGVLGRSEDVAALLIFPIAGLMVASTVEGMMTLSNWFVVALFWRVSLSQESPRGAVGTG